MNHQAEPQPVSLDTDALALSPEHLQVSFITNHREIDYFSQTIASLFACDPAMQQTPAVRVYPGSPDTQYLSNLRHHRRLEINEIGNSGWEQIKDWHVHARLAYNYHRALASPLPAGCQGVLLCEDDLIFADGFVAKLLESINEAALQQPGQLILAAYSHFDYAAESARRRGRFYCSYNASSHYGNCCLYFSKDALPGLTDFLYRKTVAKHEMPTDLAVGAYGEQIWQSGRGGMYQTVCSIAQHTGVVSGGTSSQFFSSPTFGRPWPKTEQRKTHYTKSKISTDPNESPEPVLSVCISLKNRSRLSEAGGDREIFPKSVRALADAASGIGPIELVVADFGSSDWPLEMWLKDHAGDMQLQLLQLDGEFSRGEGINIAARSARSDKLLVSDADILVNAAAIEYGIGLLEQGKAWFPVVQYLDDNGVEDFWQHAGYGVSFVPREIFLTVGGVPEFKSWGGEDEVFFEHVRGKMGVTRSQSPTLQHLWHDEASRHRYYVRPNGWDYHQQA